MIKLSGHLNLPKESL